jgi:hypothetical protein
MHSTGEHIMLTTSLILLQWYLIRPDQVLAVSCNGSCCCHGLFRLDLNINLNAVLISASIDEVHQNMGCCAPVALQAPDMPPHVPHAVPHMSSEVQQR